MFSRVFALLAITLCCIQPEMSQADDSQESQIGAQEYKTLKDKGEILSTSPYYRILDPIARHIKVVADGQYDYPFHFILVHEKDPNAFAVPGGNVYVTDSLMQFVENREELAGVLCHETSHNIHHDVVNNNAKDQRLSIAASAIGLLLGKNAGIAQTAVNYAANFQALTYSRAVESAADQKGSDTCAAAGYNPWGMVWLFEHFEKANTNGSMEMLSDHPTDSHRISDLEAHFHKYPDRFGRFSSDIHTATPLAKVVTRNGRVPYRPHNYQNPVTRHQSAPAAGTPSSNDVPRFP